MSSLTGGKIVNHEDLLFIADVSPPVQAKEGSLLFTVKEDNPWGKLVSPEFEVLLTEPSEDRNSFTTVFGEVVSGFGIFQHLINLFQAKPNQVMTISECGLI